MSPSTGRTQPWEECHAVCWKSKHEEEFRDLDSSSWKYKNCKLRLNLRSQRLEASNIDLSGEGWWTRPSPERLPSILACASAQVWGNIVYGCSWRSGGLPDQWGSGCDPPFTPCCLRSDSSYSSLVRESWSASGCHEGLMKESLGFVRRNLFITCLRPCRWADDPLHQWSLLHSSTQQHVHSRASYTPTGCLTPLVTSRAAPRLLCSLRQFFFFFFSLCSYALQILQSTEFTQTGAGCFFASPAKQKKREKGLRTWRKSSRRTTWQLTAQTGSPPGKGMHYINRGTPRSLAHTSLSKMFLKVH